MLDRQKGEEQGTDERGPRWLDGIRSLKLESDPGRK